MENGVELLLSITSSNEYLSLNNFKLFAYKNSQIYSGDLLLEFDNNTVKDPIVSIKISNMSNYIKAVHMFSEGDEIATFDKIITIV